MTGQSHDYPDHDLPMNRWYVSRYLRSATREDFTQAVTALHRDIQLVTRKTYDLKLTFYRAADPQSLHLPGARPAVATHTITAITKLTARDWHASHYVEATLTPHIPADQAFTLPVKYASATISARWPDSRRIDLEVQPAYHGREISRLFLDHNFTFWTRGYDFNPQ